MNRDLSDLLSNQGITELIASADGDPMAAETPVARKRVAEHGVKLLHRLVEDVESCQKLATDGRELIYSVLENTSAVRAIAQASRDRPGAIEVNIDRLASNRGLRDTAKRLERAVKSARKQIDAAAKVSFKRQAGRGSGDLAKMTQAGSNVPPKLLCPSNYEIDASGIWLLGGDDERTQIALGPIVITARNIDVNTGKVVLTLAWALAGRWESADLDRSTAMDSRSLTGAVADWTAPVNAVNAKHVVQWLAAVEAINLDRIPVARVTRRLGWVLDGQSGFMLGETHIPDPTDQEPGVKLVSPSGMRSVTSAFQPAGTYEGWLAAVEDALSLPLVMAAVYASAAAPLIQVLTSGQPGGGKQKKDGVENFVLDLSGGTSRGKTFSAQVALSVWGTPAKGCAMRSWDDTAFSLEGASVYLNSLPMVVDETQKADHEPQKVQDWIYRFSNGQSKGRGVKGKKDQLDQGEVYPWKSTAITTGERQITTFAPPGKTAGGTRARVLSVVGSPTGEGSPENRRKTDRIKSGIMEHHGHLGRRMVEWLIANRQKWPALWRRYNELVEHYSERSSGHVGSRLSKHVAVLHLAADILHKKLGVPQHIGDPMAAVWAAANRSAEDSDQAADALLALHSWAVAHQTSFWGRHRVESGDKGSAVEPYQGWAGRWEASKSSKPWPYIGFRVSVLKKVLRDNGFHVAAVQEAWRERGWLILPTRGDRIDKSVRMAGTAVKLVCFTRASIQQVCPAPDTSSPTTTRTEQAHFDGLGD